MLLSSIKRLAYNQLQEDPDNPLFWTDQEMNDYALEGIRDILDNTEMTLTEKSVPLFQDSTETNVPGLYSFNIGKVERITGLYWVTGTTAESKNYHELMIKRPDELDYTHPGTWRNSTSSIPSHATIWAGDQDKLGLGEILPFGFKPKIQVYPTPTDTANVSEIISNGSLLLEEFQQIPRNGTGGLMRDGDDGGENMVLSFDLDGDGDGDVFRSENSPYAGLLIDLIEGRIDLSTYENYLVMRYIPVVDYNIFIDTFRPNQENNLDGFIPMKAQYALRDYLVMRAHEKEGEMQDRKKAEHWRGKYEEKIYDVHTDNYAHNERQLRRDSNFIGAGVKTSYNGGWRW